MDLRGMTLSEKGPSTCYMTQFMWQSWNDKTTERGNYWTVSRGRRWKWGVEGQRAGSGHEHREAAWARQLFGRDGNPASWLWQWLQERTHAINLHGRAHTYTRTRGIKCNESRVRSAGLVNSCSGPVSWFWGRTTALPEVATRETRHQCSGLFTELFLQLPVSL